MNDRQSAARSSVFCAWRGPTDAYSSRATASAAMAAAAVAVVEAAAAAAAAASTETATAAAAATHLSWYFNIQAAVER